MLRLWRNELRVVLCPDKVVILGMGKGLRREVMLQAILPCTSLPGVPGWQPALDALELWLGQNEIGKANATVILSNHFVRYALMPFSEEVTSRAEEQAVARILVEGIYGEMAKQWHLQVGAGGYGEPRLIAAADSMLLVRISAVMESGAQRLSAVTPFLVSAFDSFHDQIQNPEGLFVLAETGQMIVMAFKNGQLFDVRRVPLNGGLHDQLPDLLQREALISGLDLEAVPVFVHFAERPDFELPSDGSMNIHLLNHVDKNGNPIFEDARFEMACVGKHA